MGVLRLGIFLALASGFAWGDSILLGSGALVNDPASISNGAGCGSIPISPSNVLAPSQCGIWGSGPYWDNNSGKGADMNAGYFLTGSCGIPLDCPTNYGPQQYLSSGTGSYSAPSIISLAHTSGAAVVTVLGDLTRDVTLNLGYYNASDTSLAAAVASETPICSLIPGSLIPCTQTPQSLAIASGEDYGFYLTRSCYNYCPAGDTSGTVTLFSNASLNTCTTAEPSASPATGASPAMPGCGADQHFAIFTSATPGVFYIAVDDWGLLGGVGPSNGEGFGDYSDLVLELNTTPAPEPATFGMISAGFAGLGLASFLTRKNRKTVGLNLFR